MNVLKSCWRSDNYLILANYGLAEFTNHIEPNDMREIHPSGSGVFTTLPGAVLTALITTMNVVKLPFELLAKSFSATLGILGCSKAREWSKSIDPCSTIRKIVVFSLGCIAHIIALPFLLGLGTGHLSSWVNSKLTEQLGRAEAFSYMKAKLSESKNKAPIELNIKDVAKMQKNMMPLSVAPSLCAFGFASETIQAFANKHSLTLTEEHNYNGTGFKPCKSRKYTGLYYKKNEHLCACSAADSIAKQMNNPTDTFDFNTHKWTLTPKT